VHCFTGRYEDARWYLDKGLTVSFTGIFTFKKSGDLRDVARKLPLDRLMVETDSPYLAPMPYRGKRNERTARLKPGSAIRSQSDRDQHDHIYLLMSQFVARSWLPRWGHRLTTDLDADGAWTPLTGEGMACIDYLGIAGPNRELKDDAGKQYGRNRGILIGIKHVKKGDPNPFNERLDKSGLLIPRKKIGIKHVESTSKTICVGENTTRSAWYGDGEWELAGTWASGENISHVQYQINQYPVDYEAEDDEEELYSDHPGGAYLLYVDGHVNFATEEMELDVLAAQCTRDAGRQRQR
jgi:prepilin-type processing-associated H-X9-DG protein